MNMSQHPHYSVLSVAKDWIFKLKKILYTWKILLWKYSSVRSQYDVLAWNWNKIIISLVHNYKFGLKHFLTLKIKMWKW